MLDGLKPVHDLLLLIIVILLTHPERRKPMKRGRRGSGLHGRRTGRMMEQIEGFNRWLTTHPVNGEQNNGTINARAKQYWTQNNLSAQGGYTSYKALARATRRD